MVWKEGREMQARTNLLGSHSVLNLRYGVRPIPFDRA